VAAPAGSVPVEASWSDVTTAAMPRRYDLIVMNPPFHTGREQQTSLGQRFVDVAAGGLKPGGRLLLVANALLPYEATIERTFRSQRLVLRQGGYKVIEATR